MHPLLQTILLTALLPAAVAGSCVFAASWLPPGRWRSGLIALGLALAWCAGAWLTVRAPRWPVAQAADWQFYAVAVAGIAAFLVPLREAERSWRWLAAFLFFALFFLLLLQRVLSGLWPGPGAVVWPLGLAALALVNAGAVERVGHSVQAAWTFLGLVVYAVFVSASLALSGAASLGHGVGLLASACGGMWLVSWGLRRQVDLGPVAFVASVIAGGLVVQGLFFAGLNASASLVMGLVWPVAAVAVRLLRHGSGVIRIWVLLVVLVVSLGVALLLLG